MIDPTRYKGREQTYIKHLFLDRYLERVAYVTLAGPSSWPEFAYVDGYSKPWRSSEESFEDTSVHIALTKLHAVRSGLMDQKGRQIPFRALFVEKDPGAFRGLEDLVARFNSEFRIQTIPGQFEEHIDDARRFIGSAFSLTFVDPTNFVVDLARMQPILALRGEVLINFMYSFLIRNFDKPHLLDRTFLRPSWPQELEQRCSSGMSDKDATLALFCDCVREVGHFRHVTSTRIMWPLAERTYFHLVYGTNHLRGLEEFRAVEILAMEAQHQVRFDAKMAKRQANTGMVDLFQDSPVSLSRDVQLLRERGIHDAKRRLERLLQARREFRARDAFGAILEIPLMSLSVAQQLLLRASDEGQLLLDLKPRQRVPAEITLITSRLFRA